MVSHVLNCTWGYCILDIMIMPCWCNFSHYCKLSEVRFNLQLVFQTYHGTADIENDEEYHINYISALERQVYLTLSACSSTALLSQCALTDAASLLHK